MTRFIPTTLAFVTLLGIGMVAADVAEAQRARSIAERRQRPGQGFWQPRSNQVQPAAPQQYVPQQQHQYAMPRQNRVLPRLFVAQPRPVVNEDCIVTPQPLRAETPTQVAAPETQRNVGAEEEQTGD
jgi:hypothetical protein